MTQLAAQNFAGTLAEVGIDPDKMGCIMADFPAMPVTSLLPKSIVYATDPARPWVRGKVAEQGSHVTLLYGLIDPRAEYAREPLNHRNAGQNLRGEIELLLADILPLAPVTVIGSAFFPTPGMDYGAVVLLIDGPGLREANRRLRFLPHIDTFADYKPHITLAYTATSSGDQAAEAAMKRLGGHQLTPLPVLNLGGEFK